MTPCILLTYHHCGSGLAGRYYGTRLELVTKHAGSITIATWSNDDTFKDQRGPYGFAHRKAILKAAAISKELNLPIYKGERYSKQKVEPITVHDFRLAGVPTDG